MAAKEARTLIYLHLPKCAGSTMMGVLRANYGGGFHRVGNGGKWRQFHMRSAAFRMRVECLTGHMPWGLHQYIDYPWAYTTMLRHPVERVASLYYFIRRFTGHRWHGAAKMRSVVAFARSDIFADLDNGMTRFLAGRWQCGSLKPGRAVDDNDLKLAMSHLAAMPVVGFAETFDLSLRQMAKEFGWKQTGYERKMVSKKHPRLNQEQRQRIAEHNHYDMALYEFALGLGK